MALEKIRYSPLQLALLTLLIRANAPISLSAIEVQIYINSGKRRPKRSKQSAAALIRSTSNKISKYGAFIERNTPIGRGHVASYELKGKIDFIKKTVEETIDSFSLK